MSIISKTGTDNKSTTSQFVDILLKATDNETSMSLVLLLIM